MATRKSTKKKAKPSKKAAKSSVKRKTGAAKKSVSKKAKSSTPKKVRTAARPATAKPSPAKTPIVVPRAPAPVPGAPPRPVTTMAGSEEERVGIVTHYYSHLSVAIIQMERGVLHSGDSVHIKGHTTDITQKAESMEIDHVRVPEVTARQVFGLRVIDHVREHDVVYKVPSH